MFWLSVAIAAPCSETWSAEDVRYSLDQAEVAFQGRDKTGVLHYAQLSDTQIVCLTQPVDVPLAAKFYRVQGLAAFLQRDTDAATQWFLAARAVEPEFNLPPSLVPANHPVRGLYESPAQPPQTQPIAAPAQGRILVDGRAVLVRPTDRPAIVQYVDGQGDMVWSAVLHPGHPLPPYQEAADQEAAPRPLGLNVVIGAGLARGAIDRQYNAWGQLEEGAITSTSTWDGWVTGQGPLFTAGGYLEFNDVIELGVEGQLISGQREVRAGYEELPEGGSSEDTTPLNFDPRAHPLLLAEPRMKIHVQRQDNASVYLMLGLPVGFSPGFPVDSDLDFPKAASRPSLGVAFGGGILWELSPRLGFYAELPYTYDVIGKTPRESLGAVDFAPSTPFSTSALTYRPAFGLVFRK